MSSTWNAPDLMALTTDSIHPASLSALSNQGQWKSHAFGDLFLLLRNGMSIRQDKSGEGLPITRIETIADGSVDPNRVGFAGLHEADCQQWLLRDGDILFSHINSAQLVGKCAVYRGTPEKLVHGMNLLCLRCDPDLADPEFVKYLIRSPQFRSALTTFVNKAVNQASVSIGNLKNIPVFLPPLQEQHRIAEVLDRAEALRAKRQAALAHLDELIQSIFLDMFGDPVSNPKEWVSATLGDVATFVGGGTPNRAVPEYFSGSICWATSKDMKGRFLDDTEEHVTELAVQKSATKLVPPGTILVVVKSKVLMHRLPVAVARVQTCFGQDLKGIILDDRCTISYVATAFRTCQDWLLARARGINTEGLSLDHLRRFPLLLPPLSLQKDFERRAEQVEVLRQGLDHSLAQLDALFFSLQHRAFRGEL